MIQVYIGWSIDDAKLGRPGDRENAYVTFLTELGLELRVDGELTPPLPTSPLASLPEEADPSPSEGRVMTNKVEYSLCAGVFKCFGPSLGSRIGSDGVDLRGNTESQCSPID